MVVHNVTDFGQTLKIWVLIINFLFILWTKIVLSHLNSLIVTLRVTKYYECHEHWHTMTEENESWLIKSYLTHDDNEKGDHHTRTFKHEDGHDDEHDRAKAQTTTSSQRNFCEQNHFDHGYPCTHDSTGKHTHLSHVQAAGAIPESVLRALLVGACGALAGGSSWTLRLVRL